MLAESSGLIAGGAALWVAASVVYPKRTPVASEHPAEPVASVARSNPLSPRFVSAASVQPAEQNHYSRGNYDHEPDMPPHDATQADDPAAVAQAPDVALEADGDHSAAEQKDDAFESARVGEPHSQVEPAEQIELLDDQQNIHDTPAALAPEPDVLVEPQAPVSLQGPDDSESNVTGSAAEIPASDDLSQPSQLDIARGSEDEQEPRLADSAAPAFAEDTENMQWLRPLDAPDAKRPAQTSAEDAPPAQQFAWLRSVAASASYDQSDLDVLDKSLDERISLAHTAILANDPEYFGALASAYDEDSELRPTIYALLERYNPAGARAIYQAMLLGSREDMCLAIDRLIEHGYADDLATTLRTAPPDVVEYVQFCMREAGIDAVEFTARHAEAS